MANEGGAEQCHELHDEDSQRLLKSSRPVYCLIPANEKKHLSWQEEVAM